MTRKLFTKSGRFILENLFEPGKFFIHDEEMALYLNEISTRLSYLSHPELIQLLVHGTVSVRLNSIKNLNFRESDIFISIDELTDEMREDLEDFNFDWIFPFYPAHSYFFENEEFVEWPLDNPRWPDILAMPRQTIISKIQLYLDDIASYELESSYEMFLDQP